MSYNLTLQTDRLKLRPLQPEDAERIFDYWKDPVENKYKSWIPANINELIDFVKNKVASTFDVVDTWSQLAIISKRHNQLVGDIAIHFMNPENRQIEIGYTLDKSFQGQGYATEALNEIISFLFEELNKYRIIASVDPMNKKSIVLLKRLGFRKEAHFRKSLLINGEWVDDIIYAMLKEDWIKLNDTKLAN